MPTLGRAETLCAKQVASPIKETNVKNASHLAGSHALREANEKALLFVKTVPK
jgi:hypothetical protein